MYGLPAKKNEYVYVGHILSIILPASLLINMWKKRGGRVYHAVAKCLSV